LEPEVVGVVEEIEAGADIEGAIGVADFDAGGVTVSPGRAGGVAVGRAVRGVAEGALGSEKRRGLGGSAEDGG